MAIVTPFRSDNSIDYPALEKVIEHVIAEGVQNIVSLGTTGENATLSIEEKIQIVRFTIEKSGNRVPVVVGIGGNHTAEIVHQLQHFPLEDAAAVLSVSPYYNKPSAEGLYRHYKAIAEASPKPVVLYNVPGRTGRSIPVSTVVRLANDFENIAGLKDASGDILYCMELVSRKPEDFTVVSGDDFLAMPQIACGAEGVISVAANLFAEEVGDMVRHALNQNFQEARKIHYKLLPAVHSMFIENNPAGVKAFLSLSGLIEENLRLPLVPVQETLKKQIASQLKTIRH